MYSIGVREARRRTCDCMPRGEDVEPGRKRGRGTGKRKKKKKRGGGERRQREPDTGGRRLRL